MSCESKCSQHRFGKFFTHFTVRVDESCCVLDSGGRCITISFVVLTHSVFSHRVQHDLRSPSQAAVSLHSDSTVIQQPSKTSFTLTGLNSHSLEVRVKTFLSMLYLHNTCRLESRKISLLLGKLLLVESVSDRPPSEVVVTACTDHAE